MFRLYKTGDTESSLSPRDFQFIQTPSKSFDNASLYYEKDYRRYSSQYASTDLPYLKTENNSPFNPLGSYPSISGYNPIYKDTERSLTDGWSIGIDTSERWDRFHRPFYF